MKKTNFKAKYLKKKHIRNIMVFLIVLSLIVISSYAVFAQQAAVQQIEYDIEKDLAKGGALTPIETALIIIVFIEIVLFSVIKKQKKKKQKDIAEKGFFRTILTSMENARFSSSKKLLKTINKLIDEKRRLIALNLKFCSEKSPEGIQETELAFFKDSCHPSAKKILNKEADKGIIGICDSLADINKELLKYFLEATRLSKKEMVELSKIGISVKEEERDLLAFFRAHGNKLNAVSINSNLKKEEKTINHLKQVGNELMNDIAELNLIIGSEKTENKDETTYIKKEKESALKLKIDSNELKKLKEDECKKTLDIIKACSIRLHELFEKENILLKRMQEKVSLKERIGKLLKEETKTFKKEEDEIEKMRISVSKGPILHIKDVNGKEFKTNTIERFYFGLIYSNRITNGMFNDAKFNSTVVSWMSSFELNSIKELAKKIEGKNRNEMIKIIGESIGKPISDLTKMKPQL